VLSGVALLVLPGLDRRDHRARRAVMAINILAALRYLAWRVEDTVPPLSADPVALWMWLVLALETLSLVHLVLTALFLTRRTDRRAAADAAEAGLRAASSHAAVDVVIPSYNEPMEVLERTLVGALALDWPGEVAVWVLDDGRRAWLATLCADLGVRWQQRDGNAHGKAGNVNAWLAATAGRGAPVVMVLDADFVPQRHFLWRTVGLLQEAGVGLVQTPQSFFNPDPIQMNLLCGPTLADEQRFFYHEVQPCLDAWGAAFCCGTSFVARRPCLDAIGGIPTDTVTEDMMTTYALNRLGWRTVWLDEPLSAGLAAEGLAEFLNQRARWCLGTVQALRLPSSPLRASGVPAMSRLAFVNALLFWIVSFPLTLASMLAPAIFWWTGVPAFLAQPGTFLGHFAPRFVAEAAALWWASDGAILPLLSGVAALLTAPSAIGATVIALARPQGQRFKVTLKGGDRTRVVVHWRLAAWIGALMAAIASGMAIDQLDGLAVLPPGASRGVNTLWSAYALGFLFLALLVCIEVPRRRPHERLPMAEPTRLARGGWRLEATLEDLSLTGARLRLAAGDVVIADGDGLAVEIAEVGTLAVALVRRHGDHLSLRFVGPPPVQRQALLRKLYTGPAVLRRQTPDLFRALRRVLRRSFVAED